MSGGVDSSVTAALLKKQGHDVLGLFMRNWDEKDPDGTCSADRDFADVARVCDQLDIPYYSVNFEEEYWENVFAQFLEQYKAGLTPNPDVLCNREIKFKVLWEKAQDLGADFLATGHYCRIFHKNSHFYLQRGLDPNKDQSYFLYQIENKVLNNVLFPIGELEKSKVRDIARELNLQTSEKKDSTGICFIGKRKFRDFLSRYLPAQSGEIIDLEGNFIGKHHGIAFYTIGQRKGLEIGGAGQAWFVVDKKAEQNQLVVCQGSKCKELFSKSCTTLSPHWLLPQPPKFPLYCSAKIRYRTKDAVCTVEESREGLCVQFHEPQRAITPGQSIVFYDGEICLGGAIIKTRSRENF